MVWDKNVYKIETFAYSSYRKITHLLHFTSVTKGIVIFCLYFPRREEVLYNKYKMTILRCVISLPCEWYVYGQQVVVATGQQNRLGIHFNIRSSFVLLLHNKNMRVGYYLRKFLLVYFYFIFKWNFIWNKWMHLLRNTYIRICVNIRMLEQFCHVDNDTTKIKMNMQSFMYADICYQLSSFRSNM